MDGERELAARLELFNLQHIAARLHDTARAIGTNAFVCAHVGGFSLTVDNGDTFVTVLESSERWTFPQLMELIDAGRWPGRGPDAP